MAGYLGGALFPTGLWKWRCPWFLLSLLIPTMPRGPKAAVALAAVITAVVTAKVPMKLGLILAVTVGCLHESLLDEKFPTAGRRTPMTFRLSVMLIDLGDFLFRYSFISGRFTLNLPRPLKRLWNISRSQSWPHWLVLDY